MKNGGRAALLVGAILLTGLNLRIALASVAPVYTFIQEDLGIGRAAAGLVVTLPVLCMAIFAPLATLVGHRLGRKAMILFSVALIGGATALRVEGGLFTLFASALAVGVGIATVQALMPEVIKQSFPTRTATMNGAYTASMALGATVAASAVVPLTAASGWPAALSVWGLLALPALLAWLPVGEVEREGGPRSGSVQRLPLGVSRVWMTMLFFAMTSLMYFSVLSWISQVYEDAGLSPVRAGLALSGFTGVQILSAFLVPTLANRFPDRRPVLIGVIGTTVVALVLILTVPNAAPWMPFAWTALIGASQGALFPLALTLPLDTTRTGEMAGKLTSACFLAGYGVASLGPATIGALRDATGGFTIPLLILTAVACAQIALTTRLTPNFHIEDG